MRIKIDGLREHTVIIIFSNDIGFTFYFWKQNIKVVREVHINEDKLPKWKAKTTGIKKWAKNWNDPLV